LGTRLVALDIYLHTSLLSFSKQLFKHELEVRKRFNYSNHTYFGSKISKWYPL